MRPVAVLYQAAAAPKSGGALKPLKPGGYRDSGADIGYALQCANFPVVTPQPDPAPDQEDAWTFGDTASGIAQAVEAGAEILWANTTLYSGHPIVRWLGRISVIGQEPQMVDRFEDKWVMHQWLEKGGYPVPQAMRTEAFHEPHWTDCENAPMIVKPVRGRGSQGVVRADNLDDLRRIIQNWEVGTYGAAVMVESYLPGQEVTVSVLPPGDYRGRKTRFIKDHHWALPPVIRQGHVDGMMPYSGVAPVAGNSAVANQVPQELANFVAQCESLADSLNPRGVVRVDGRQDGQGIFRMVDVNFKPNLSGPGRPGRDGQASLVAMAAEAAGWPYPLLVENLARQCWV